MKLFVGEFQWTELHRCALYYDACDALNVGDATIEDPVGGGTAVCSRAALTVFYGQAVAMQARIERVTSIHASHGNAAATAFDILVNTPDGVM